EVGAEGCYAAVYVARAERRLADRAQRLDRNDADDPLTEEWGRCERHIRAHRVPDQHQLRVGDLTGDRRHILRVVGHRPFGAVATGRAVPGEIERHHGVTRLEGIELR